MKAAFVDHSFHKYTKSNKFLKDLLIQNGYELDEFYDDSWQGGSKPDVSNLSGYDTIFYFQLIHPPRELIKLQEKNIVWFPMENAFDGQISEECLQQLSEIKMKVVCFSKTSYTLLSKAGFDCFYLQFFFNPESLPRKEGYGNPPKVMFWQRVDEIRVATVRTVCSNNSIIGLDWLFLPDPGMVGYVPNILLKTPDVYLQRVVSADIYFAPRKHEGIGMAFLEAMAMGLCVVTPNTPTMNEYIVHKRNGLLYDLGNPQELDFTGYELMGRTAKKESSEGHKAMLIKEAEMINFVKGGKW